jgi:hypothetical protein
MRAPRAATRDRGDAAQARCPRRALVKAAAWFGDIGAAKARAVTRAFRRYAAFLGREPL